eukprot:UN00264
MDQVIDLDRLSPQDIQELHRTMMLEIDAVGQNISQLRGAHTKYLQSLNSVKQLVPSEDKAVESLIPLTPSMYMIGEIREVQKVLVDIGTGYFVEKPLDKAILFFEDKVKLVDDQLDKLETILAAKRNDLAKVRASMNMRQKAFQNAVRK